MAAFGRCLLPVVVLLTGCGYVGDPLPPALNIPGRVADLRARQRADKIIVQFTIPALTTDALPLKLGSADLRAGVPGNAPFDAGAWTARARALENTCLEPGPCRVEISARDWIGQEVFFRVRILSKNGRDGGWSDFAILKVVPPLRRPFGLQAEAVPQGVRLTWQGPTERPGLLFRVRRRNGSEKSATVVATVANRQWGDDSTVYGQTYEYSVVAVVKAGEKEAESDVSETVEVKPEDRFPPSVPSGLAALAGPTSIELVWRRNTEPDFRGYRLYRAAGDGPFERIVDLIETPSYSDRRVETGKRYRYEVTSVDQLGNESERSAPVEATAP